MDKFTRFKSNTNASMNITTTKNIQQGKKISNLSDHIIYR